MNINWKNLGLTAAIVAAITAVGRHRLDPRGVPRDSGLSARPASVSSVSACTVVLDDLGVI